MQFYGKAFLLALTALLATCQTAKRGKADPMEQPVIPADAPFKTDAYEIPPAGSKDYYSYFIDVLADDNAHSPKLHLSGSVVGNIFFMFILYQRMRALIDKGQDIGVRDLISMGIHIGSGASMFGISIPGIQHIHTLSLVFELAPIFTLPLETEVYNVLEAQQQIPSIEFNDANRVSSTYLICNHYDTSAAVAKGRRKKRLYWDWARVENVKKPRLFNAYKGYIVIVGRWVRLKGSSGGYVFATNNSVVGLISACKEVLDLNLGEEVSLNSIGVTAGNNRLRDYPVLFYLDTAIRNSQGKYVSVPVTSAAKKNVK